MEINSLLNPSTDDHHGYRVSVPSMPAAKTSPHSSVAASKRQKVAKDKVPKDAPVFSEGNKIVGLVNYPPHEAGGDLHLEAQHRLFQVFPLGEIRKKGVRHIPYNSDKKDFFEKTGREAFEVFQYTFERPGENKKYVVVWDYNVGLVRMTPFFKACKYAKTVPAKALKENIGLKDISYSITGGALVCQGYWIPYSAAKAIAATFCHDIRWVLTPVFGNDFPSMCLHPEDPNFAKFFIDPNIVNQCAIDTSRFRLEGEAYRILTPLSSPLTEAPKIHFNSPPWRPRVLRPRKVQPADIESGYGTDTDHSDKYIFSPEVSPRSQWTPINRSLSPPCSPKTPNSSVASSPINSHAPPLIQLPNAEPDECYSERLRAKRTHSKVACSEHGYDETMASPLLPAIVDSDRMYGYCTGANRASDVEAAELLLSLKGGGNMLVPSAKRTRHGSR